MVLLLQRFIFKIGTAQEANHQFKPGAQNKHRTSTIYQHHKYILHVSNNKHKHNPITTGYTCNSMSNINYMHIPNQTQTDTGRKLICFGEILGEYYHNVHRA